MRRRCAARSSSSPRAPTPPCRWPESCYARGDPDGALALLREVPGSFAADGLAARIALERREPALGLWPRRSPPSTPAISERALDLFIGALPSADGAKDDIRRVVVGILDELGVDSPLARESRRRLASALY